MGYSRARSAMTWWDVTCTDTSKHVAETGQVKLAHTVKQGQAPRAAVDLPVETASVLCSYFLHFVLADVAQGAGDYEHSTEAVSPGKSFGRAPHPKCSPPDRKLNCAWPLAHERAHQSLLSPQPAEQSQFSSAHDKPLSAKSGGVVAMSRIC